MSGFYQIFKKIAFQFDPEFVHNFAVGSFERLPWMARCWNRPVHPTKFALDVNGNKWPFPLGLAAGFDENGRAIDFFTRLKFGAVEIGTVTPKFQIGNERPRLWRYPKDESFRNSMGFNNLGSELVYQNIYGINRNGKVLGVNIGKNKITPKEKAKDDYKLLYDKFSPLADYLVVNVSSPNTPGLRELLAKEYIRDIFQGLSKGRMKNPRPLYLKISPDQDLKSMEETIEVAKEFNLAGIIATNTTIMEERGKGGISGKLLREKSRGVRKFVMERIREVPNMQLIAVGGIFDFEDLWEHWKMGGKVAQIYTSFVYKGPSILEEFEQKIDAILSINKLETLSELISNIRDIKR